MTKHISRASWVALFSTAAVVVTAQSGEVDWTKANADALEHYSAIVRFDTTAKERPAAEYIKKVLDDQASRRKSTRSNRIARTSSRASRATAASGRC